MCRYGRVLGERIARILRVEWPRLLESLEEGVVVGWGVVVVEEGHVGGPFREEGGSGVSSSSQTAAVVHSAHSARHSTQMS